eukprot:364860-Chlamydomonas_euryale.AAC.2
MHAANTRIQFKCMHRTHASNADARTQHRYVKKKKLDPLDTYVPLALEARQQLLTAGATMGEATCGQTSKLAGGQRRVYLGVYLWGASHRNNRGRGCGGTTKIDGATVRQRR